MPTRFVLALLMLCGCAVLVGAKPPVAPPVPPMPPAEEKPTDEKLLKERKIGTDAASLLAFFKKRSLDAKALEEAADLVKELGNDDYFKREKATDDLRKRGPGVVPLLRRALADPDEEIKDRARALLLALESKTSPAVTQAAIRLLKTKVPPEAVQALFDYLPAAENEAVEEEVFNALAVLGVKDGKVEKLLDEALKDKQATRRAAAGLVVGRSGTADQKKAAAALLTDTDLTVRFRAAQGLLAGKDRAAVPVLCALLADAPMPEATRAEELLQCLAAGQPPKTPPFSEDAALRKRAKQVWEEWWKQNGKMDLTAAEIDLPPFNPSLKAREVIRQFSAAVMTNDLDALKKTIDAPFLAYGNQLMENKQDAERYVEGNNIPGRNQGVLLQITGTVNVAKYKQGNLQQPEKDFLARFKKASELRAFNVAVPFNPQFGQQGEEYTMFVRTVGDQVKIVGFSQPRGRAPLDKW